MAELPSFMASQGARLIDNGYSILPIRPGVKSPGRYQAGEWGEYPDWQRHCDRPTKGFEYDIWSRWPGCAIGIACGSVVGLDIDVLDADVAQQIEALTRQMLGDTPAIRIGQAPKRMLIYRAVIPFAGRKRHPLELLARGQQFLAYAIHPGTQRPYSWPEDSLSEIDIASLPEITEAQGHAWLDAAFDLVPEALRKATILGSGKDVSAWTGPSDPRGTLAAIRSALEYIPNTDLDGSSWVMIGNALKAALGEAGRPVWLDWSQSSAKSGASGKSDTAERRWKGFRPVRIGAGSIYYLAEQRGWIPDGDMVLNAAELERQEAPHPAAALMARLNAPIAAKAPPAPMKAVPVKASLLDVDGALKLLVDWIVSTAISPQPFLALGAALCAVGTVAGRKYRTQTNLRTNLYVIGIADSGGGKDQARVCVKEALFAAGLGEYLGGEELASGTGILASLQRHPSRLFLIDEMGKFLAAANNPRAPAHKVEVLTTLTKLFTSAGGVLLGTEYADQGKMGRPRVDIHQPCASVYGVTVPSTFWSALETGALGDGSIARFLIFLSDCDYPDRNKRPGSTEVPPEIVAALHAISAGVAPAADAGNLAGINAVTAPEPYTVPMTADAAALLDKLTDDQTEWLRQVRGTPATAIIARLWENASRLALIRAISRAPQDPVITGQDVQWATDLVDHCVKTLLQEANRFIADNEVEASHKAVMEIIRQAGTIPQNLLTRRTQNLKQRERSEILAALVEAGLISISTHTAEAGGRPTRSYSLIGEADTLSAGTRH